ncbi:hypothetical protein [Borrelia miyamotoi]|uniref:hypothetical protein n=1 Tax=Borrelia miyamotoi TaxID=47466 RepID=UPI001F5B2D44|nr:hypothetical protein [Borrelia miyamotoi]WVI05280.1 hypothetical protein F9Y91_00160 [Borrelia miyamotoi]
MKKIIHLFLNLAILSFIFSCTTIASLMDEPNPPIKHTIKDLSTYEAKLADYISITKPIAQDIYMRYSKLKN